MTKITEGQQRAIVKIEAKINGSTSLGTGCVIGPRLVLTAFHVVADRSAGAIPNNNTIFGGVTVSGHKPTFMFCYIDGDFNDDWALLELQDQQENWPSDIQPLPCDLMELGPNLVWRSFGYPKSARDDGRSYDGGFDKTSWTHTCELRWSEAHPTGEQADIVSGLSGAPIFVNGCVVGIINQAELPDSDAAARSNSSHKLWGLPLAALFVREHHKVAKLRLAELATTFDLVPPQKQDLPEEPFVGIRPFEKADTRIFFGRSQEIRQIRDWLNRSGQNEIKPVLILQGLSGVGKSSLLQAGLLPRLEQDWHVTYSRRDKDLGLPKQLKNACQEQLPQGKTRRLIVLDQVEECFTQPSPSMSGKPTQNTVDTSHNVELVELVGALQGSNDKSCRVILSLRSDWSAQVRQAFEQDNRQTQPEYILVEGLSDRGFQEAILSLMRWQATREQYNLEIKRELVDTLRDRIVHDNNDDRTPKSVILQIVLTHMWERVKAGTNGTRVFDTELHSAVWNASARKHPLDVHFDLMLEAAQKLAPALFASGLALDVLQFHTSDHRTAIRRTQADLEDQYKHILVTSQDALTLLTTILTHSSVRLLVRSDTNPPATYLVHDLLAPIIREKHRQSLRPGQLARFVLEGHAPVQKDTPLLGSDAVKRIEAGRMGMRGLSPEEEKLLKASTAKVRRDRVWKGSVFLVLPVLLLFVAALSYIQQDTRLKRIRALADADPTTAALLLRENTPWLPWLRDDWRLLGMKVLQQPLSQDRWHVPEEHRPLALAADGQRLLAVTDREVVWLDRGSTPLAKTLLPRGDVPVDPVRSAAKLFEPAGRQPHALIRWDNRLLAWDLKGPLMPWSVTDVSDFAAAVDGQHVLAWHNAAASSSEDGSGSQRETSDGVASAPAMARATLSLLDGKTGKPFWQLAASGQVMDAAFDSSGAWVVVLVQTPDGATELRCFATAAPLTEGTPIHVGSASPTALAAHPTTPRKFLVLAAPQARRHEPAVAATNSDSKANGGASQGTEGHVAKADKTLLFGETQVFELTLDEKGVKSHSTKLAEGAYPRDHLVVSPQLDYFVLSDRLGDQAVMLADSLLNFSQKKEARAIGLNPTVGVRRRELSHLTLHDPDSPIHALRFVQLGQSASQLATLSGTGVRYWNPAGQLADLQRKAPLRVGSGFSGGEDDYIDCGPGFEVTNEKVGGYLSCRRYLADQRKSYDIMIPIKSIAFIDTHDPNETSKPDEQPAQMVNLFSNQLCSQQQRQYYFGNRAILEVDLTAGSVESDGSGPIPVFPKMRRIFSDLPVDKVTCDLKYALGRRPGPAAASEPMRALMKYDASANRFRMVAPAQDSVARRDLCGPLPQFVGLDLGGDPSAALVICKAAIYQFSPPDSTSPTRIDLAAPTYDGTVTNAGYNEQQSIVFQAIGQQSSAPDPEGDFQNSDAERIRPQRLSIQRRGEKVKVGPFRAWPPLSSTALDISPDGQWFAVPQGEHVRLAKVLDPSQYVDLGYGGIPKRVQFSPHGDWLEASSIAGPGQRWPLSPRAIACSLWQLSTCLSKDERIEFGDERPAAARAHADPKACAEQRQKKRRDCPAP